MVHCKEVKEGAPQWKFNDLVLDLEKRYGSIKNRTSAHLVGEIDWHDSVGSQPILITSQD